MRETQKTITRWAEDTFGVATVPRIISRANEEMAELITKATIDPNDPKIAEEVADIIIVLARVGCYLGFDIAEEVDKKMRINRARNWEKDGSGCAYHIKESP